MVPGRAASMWLTPLPSARRTTTANVLIFRLTRVHGAVPNVGHPSSSQLSKATRLPTLARSHGLALQ
jgi:hypothetical protein